MVVMCRALASLMLSMSAVVKIHAFHFKTMVLQRLGVTSTMVVIHQNSITSIANISCVHGVFVVLKNIVLPMRGVTSDMVVIHGSQPKQRF